MGGIWKENQLKFLNSLKLHILVWLLQFMMVDYFVSGVSEALYAIKTLLLIF